MESRRAWRKRVMEATGLGRALYDGSQGDLTRAVTDAAPWVRTVQWQTFSPGHAVARLRVHWWAWLTLGVLHVIGWRRAHQVIDEYKAVGTTILVSMW